MQDSLEKKWNDYAKAGFENVDRTNSTKGMRKQIEKLMQNPRSSGGILLDHGCGTGGMFKIELQTQKPERIVAVDWSKSMLNKAELSSAKLQNSSPTTQFEFQQVDLSKVPYPWPIETYQVIVSSLTTCYLAGGWKEPLKELYRVLQKGGYIYLSTFLDKWNNFPTSLSRFALEEIIRSPIGVYYGIRFRKIAEQIREEAKARGAEFPALDELTAFLENLGFTEIKKLPIYWGFGLALRAKKS